MCPGSVHLLYLACRIFRHLTDKIGFLAGFLPDIKMIGDIGDTEIFVTRYDLFLLDIQLGLVR